MCHSSSTILRLFWVTSSLARALSGRFIDGSAAARQTSTTICLFTHISEINKFKASKHKYCVGNYFMCGLQCSVVWIFHMLLRWGTVNNCGRPGWELSGIDLQEDGNYYGYDGSINLRRVFIKVLYYLVLAVLLYSGFCQQIMEDTWKCLQAIVNHSMKIARDSKILQSILHILEIKSTCLISWNEFTIYSNCNPCNVFV